MVCSLAERNMDAQSPTHDWNFCSDIEETHLTPEVSIVNNTSNLSINGSSICDADNVSTITVETDDDMATNGPSNNGIFMTEESGAPPVIINVPDIDNNNCCDTASAGNVSICDTSSVSTDPPSGTGSNASLIHSKRVRRNYFENPEKWYEILQQLGLPFFIAGFGMVGAGILLDYVSKTIVFEANPTLIVLVTPLLGLKGDLGMTLASRLSTLVNTRSNKQPGEKWKIIYGNLSLDQLQAVVCGIFATFIATLSGFITQGVELDYNKTNLMFSSAMLTASIVSVVLGSLMIGVIFMSHKYGWNPDNIATPVAGTTGDLVTLSALWFFSGVMYNQMQAYPWIPFIVYGFYVLLILPLCCWIAYHNEYAHQVLRTGWIPVILSVAISTGGGILLDLASSRYDGRGIPLYQPVINGIGGNLVSIQASRIATQFHRDYMRGDLPKGTRVCESPFSVFCSKGSHSMSARLLLAISIPAHLIFATVGHYVNEANQQPSDYGVVFMITYLVAAFCQIALLLYIAKVMTNYVWKRRKDPDTITIPYLTAFGDLFGSTFLFIAFEFLTAIRG